MKQPTIAFIGAGNMATALIGGLIADGTAPDKIIASDADPDKCQALGARYGVRHGSDNAAAVAQADLVVLAVKPQVLKTVAGELSAAVQQRKPLLVSIAAGVRTATLESWLGGDVAVVRSMPNTPAMLGVGATGLYANARVSAAQRELAESLLRAVGVTRWVAEESLIDAVTAVSGSGPAYFFLFIEAIEEAAMQLGLDPETARLLTLQTALGAARMAMESEDDPATLRHKVTSPGGTTEQALNSFEQSGLRRVVSEALLAARDRSLELSQLLANPQQDD